jgi:hypothetical protein
VLRTGQVGSRANADLQLVQSFLPMVPLSIGVVVSQSMGQLLSSFVPNSERIPRVRSYLRPLR